MITRIGIQFYQLSPLDSFGLRVTGNGVQYHVVASLDTTVVPFVDGVTTDITPQMMSGAGSLHIANVHCFFGPGSAGNADYTVEVLDSNGVPIDILVAAAPSAPPTQVFFQLIFFVTA